MQTRSNEECVYRSHYKLQWVVHQTQLYQRSSQYTEEHCILPLSVLLSTSLQTHTSSSHQVSHTSSSHLLTVNTSISNGLQNYSLIADIHSGCATLWQQGTDHHFTEKSMGIHLPSSISAIVARWTLVSRLPISFLPVPIPEQNFSTEWHRPFYRLDSCHPTISVSKHWRDHKALAILNANADLLN